MIKLILTSVLISSTILSFGQNDLDSLFKDSNKGAKHLIELDLGAMFVHGKGLHLQYGTMLGERTRLLAGVGYYDPSSLSLGVHSSSTWGPTVTLGLRRYGKRYDPLHFSMSIISGVIYRFKYHSSSIPNIHGVTRSIANSITPYIGWGLFYPKLEISVIFGLGYGISSIDFNDDLISESDKLRDYPTKGLVVEFGPKIGYKF